MSAVARRALFGSAATFALAPAVVAGAQHPDRELLQLCKAFHELGQAGDAVSGPSDADDRAHDLVHAARWDAADAVRLLQPVTDEGRAAKASVGVALLMASFDPGEDARVDFALNALREIADLSGRVRT